MKPIPIWHADLCVRNPELDAQHIIMLEIGRELIRVIECPSECDSSLLELLGDIVAVTRRHHEMEETVLEANCCPTLPAVADTHSLAQTMLEDMFSDVLHECADTNDIGRQLSDWMHHHIYETDMPVRAFLRG